MHGTSLPDGVHEKPAAGVTETRLVPGGIVSETTGAGASEGPVFVAVIV